MLRFLIGLFLALAALHPQPALAVYDHGPVVDAMRQEFEAANRLDLARKTDKAMDAALTTAIWKMRQEADLADSGADRAQRRGALMDAYSMRERAGQLRALADDVEAEWQGQFAGAVVQMVQILEAAGPMADVPELYEPMSQWLRLRLQQIEDLLGTQIYVMLHLDDLQTMNEGTPVVLRLRKYMGDKIPTAEIYEQYFCPWSGVVAYWLVWGGCTAATWGAGWAVICTPAAMIAERLVLTRVAPRWTNKVWARVYDQ
jgi:hypothetical protein